MSRRDAKVGIDWTRSQAAEAEFWQQGDSQYAHFSRQYWLGELRNWDGAISPEEFAGKNIIEIGCGPKGMIHFVEANRKVGVDPLIGEYKRLRILEDGDVEHVEGVGEALSFPEGAFDMVICFNVLDHSREPWRVCQEMSRILKKGGRVVFHSHCISPLFKPVRGLLTYFDKPHPWHFTLRELERMFADAGLRPTFSKITLFHWKARTLLRHIAAKAIIRNYFGILQK